MCIVVSSSPSGLSRSGPLYISGAGYGPDDWTRDENTPGGWRKLSPPSRATKYVNSRCKYTGRCGLFVLLCRCSRRGNIDKRCVSIKKRVRLVRKSDFRLGLSQASDVWLKPFAPCPRTQNVTVLHILMNKTLGIVHVVDNGKAITRAYALLSRHIRTADMNFHPFRMRACAFWPHRPGETFGSRGNSLCVTSREIAFIATLGRGNHATAWPPDVTKTTYNA